MCEWLLLLLFVYVCDILLKCYMVLVVLCGEYGSEMLLMWLCMSVYLVFFVFDDVVFFDVIIDLCVDVECVLDVSVVCVV